MEHFRWQLTTSGSGRIVSAIPAWCVYESTGFHLGNIGQDPSATVLLPGRTAHPLGTPPHPASATALALGNPVQSRPGTAASDSTPSLTAPRPQLTRHPPNRTSPQTRASPVREHLSPRPLPAISPYPTSPDGHKVSPRRLKTDTGPIYPNRARTIASLCPSSPILLLQRHTFGGFGLNLLSRTLASVTCPNPRDRLSGLELKLAQLAVAYSRRSSLTRRAHAVPTERSE